MARRRRTHRKSRTSRPLAWFTILALVLCLMGLGLLRWSRTPQARALLLRHGVERYFLPVQAGLDSALCRLLDWEREGAAAAEWPVTTPPGATIHCRTAVVDSNLTIWEWEERLAAAVAPLGGTLLWAERLAPPRGTRTGGVWRLDLGVPGYPTHTVLLVRGGRPPRVRWGRGPAESLAELLGPPAQPTVALVIDDWGYHMDATTGGLLALDVPLTLSVLPGLPFSRHFALQGTDLAVPRRTGGAGGGGLAARRRAAGCPVTVTLGRPRVPTRRREIMLHLPMQPQGYPGVNPGRDPVLVGMSREEIAAILDRDLRGLPNVTGVNNHMGSAATADRPTMERLVAELAARDLFFLDSMTTSRSVGAEVARAHGLPLLRNRLFLDQADPHEDAIARRLARLVRAARATGFAIGIGHPYPQTLAVLQRELPRYRREGIRFVTVSELIALRRAVRNDGAEEAGEGNRPASGDLAGESTR